MENKIRVEGDTVEDAKSKIQAQIPKGLSITSEKIISDGLSKTLKGVGDSFESAIEQILKDLPEGKKVIDKKELNPSDTKKINISEYDEDIAKYEVNKKLKKYESITNISIIKTGRKGFLGLFKTPNIYEVEVYQPFVVEVTVKSSAIIEAILGLPEPTSEDVKDFFNCVENGNLSGVKKYLETKSNQKLVTARDDVPYTALHYACLRGYTEIAKLLVENGADVNAPEPNQIVPIHMASQNGHFEIVKILIDKGANLNLADRNWKTTSLHYAAMEGHKDIVKLLISKGANLNARDVDGLTPLQLAIKEGRNELKELFTSTAKPSQATNVNNEKYQTIKNAWKANALNWWNSSGKTSCYCDDNACLVDGQNRMQSKKLKYGEGYIPQNSTRIYCEECADRRLKSL